MGNRRHFLKRTIAGALGATIAGPGRSWAVAAPGAGGRPYAFPVVGDLHFDRPEHHAFDWVREHHPRDLRQIEGYCDFTERTMGRLLERVGSVVRRSNSPVPMVLHVGDFVEGVCGSRTLAERQCRDAVAMVQAAKLGAPFLMTKGNHDVTGPGAREAYDDVIVPFLGEEAASAAGQGIEAARFTRREGGGILFVFFDAYDSGRIDWLERLLENRGEGRLFFVIHPPVIPYNARSNWHQYGRDENDDRRDRLLRLLGENHAIVISGHLHRYSLLKRRVSSGTGGMITQLAVSSVDSGLRERPEEIRVGVKAYGPGLVELEPAHAPDTVEERREILRKEKAFIESFEYARSWGFAMVRVGADAVEAELYHGVEDEKAWRTVRIA